MNDMAPVIVPKSDQINADDLISGPINITIRGVEIKSEQDQPVSIFFEGSDKIFRPCKSMSRVMVAVWGADSKNYVTRSLTLYRDAGVKWGGMEVGGVRISHMTHMDGPMTMALTATKGSRKPYTVHPLVLQANDPAEKWVTAYIAKLVTMTNDDEITAFETGKAAKLAELADKRPDLHKRVIDALAQFRSELPSVEKADPPSPPLWKQLVGRAGAATTLDHVKSVQDEFDERDAEVPFADQLAVQDAIDAATVRLTEGE